MNIWWIYKNTNSGPVWNFKVSQWTVSFFYIAISAVVGSSAADDGEKMAGNAASDSASSAPSPELTNLTELTNEVDDDVASDIDREPAEMQLAPSGE